MVPVDPRARSACWVLVADEFQARIFSRQKKFSALVEEDRLENPLARMKTSEVISDRGGRAFDSKGKGRHTVGSDKGNPKTESYAAFAREIAERIARASRGGAFWRLVVVAAPRFLGVLRPALASAGLEAERTFDKAVTGRDADFIRKLIDAE